MAVVVSASPEAVQDEGVSRGEPPTPEQMALAKARIQSVLDDVQAQMREAMSVRSEHAADPVEAALERAAQKRAAEGTARSSEQVVADMRASPSLVVTLEHELSSLCARLGELRANYAIQEAAMLRQIEATAAKVAMAKEMSK